jgi:hypothetical protein
MKGWVIDTSFGLTQHSDKLTLSAFGEFDLHGSPASDVKADQQEDQTENGDTCLE